MFRAVAVWGFEAVKRVYTNWPADFWRCEVCKLKQEWFQLQLSADGCPAVPCCLPAERGRAVCSGTGLLCWQESRCHQTSLLWATPVIGCSDIWSAVLGVKLPEHHQHLVLGALLGVVQEQQGEAGRGEALGQTGFCRPLQCSHLVACALRQSVSELGLFLCISFSSCWHIPVYLGHFALAGGLGIGKRVIGKGGFSSSEYQLSAWYLNILLTATTKSLETTVLCSEQLSVALQFPPQGVGERGFSCESSALLFSLVLLLPIFSKTRARWDKDFVYVGRSAVFNLGTEFCLPLSFY